MCVLNVYETVVNHRKYWKIERVDRHTVLRSLQEVEGFQICFDSVKRGCFVAIVNVVVQEDCEVTTFSSKQGLPTMLLAIMQTSHKGVLYRRLTSGK
jgi:hypothetical protein